MITVGIVAVSALVVVDILVVLGGIHAADLVDMTAIVPRIDHNIAAVALHVEQAYLAVVVLGLTVAAASFFKRMDYCHRNVSKNRKKDPDIEYLQLNGSSKQPW